MRLPSAHFRTAAAPGTRWPQSSLLRVEELEARLVPVYQALAPRFEVNNVVALAANPQAALDSQGRALIAWTDRSSLDTSGQGIYLRRFDSAGTPVANQVRANSTLAGDQHSVAVALDPAGNALVAWLDYPDSGGDAYAQTVHAQRYNASGVAVGGNFVVHQSGVSDGTQAESVQVFARPSGEFAVHYVIPHSGQGIEHHVQWYSADGSTGTHFMTTLAATEGWTHGDPGNTNRSVQMDASGNFFIAWPEQRQRQVVDVGLRYDDRALLRRLDAQGAVLGPDIVLATRPEQTFFDNSMLPSVTLLPDGGFVAGWYVRKPDNEFTLLARRFSAAGQPVSAVYDLTPEHGFYYGARLATLSDGNVAVAWFNHGAFEGGGGRVRVVTPDGAALSRVIPVDSNQRYHGPFSIVPDQDGGFLLAWGGAGGIDVDGKIVYGQRFQNAPLTPTRLVVTAEPLESSWAAGTGFGFSVALQDDLGNLAEDFTGNVTIRQSGGPTGAVLEGSLTVAAVDGVATFAGLSLRQAGFFYMFTMEASGLAPATVGPFSVLPGTATRLVVIEQPPTEPLVLAPFGLSVAAHDAFGNLVTRFTGTVTVSLTDPSTPLEGFVTEPAFNGVAHITHVFISSIGTYTFRVTAPGLAPVDSNPFTTFDLPPPITTPITTPNSPPPSTAVPAPAPAPTPMPAAPTWSAPRTIKATGLVATFRTLSVNRVPPNTMVTVRVSTSAGKLQLRTTGLRVAGSNTRRLTLTGSQAAVNRAMRAMKLLLARPRSRAVLSLLVSVGRQNRATKIVVS